MHPHAARKLVLADSGEWHFAGSVAAGRLAGVGVDALGLGQRRSQRLRQPRNGYMRTQVLQVDLVQADRHLVQLGYEMTYRDNQLGPASAGLVNDHLNVRSLQQHRSISNNSFPKVQTWL